MSRTRMGLLFVPFVATLAHAADPPAPPDPVAVEVFKAPQFITGSASVVYPADQGWAGAEGWVQLNFMVDPQGTPFEPTVVDSSGNPAFEKAALKAIVRARYKPAMSGKTPVPSSQDLKFYFTLGIKGASPQFIGRYRDAMKAVEAGDRATA